VALSVAADRRRERESDATRRAILDAAGRLLSTVGEPGLNIREVCARAGVTAPTIYHHFGDKDALVDRVVDECFAAFDRDFAERTPPSDPVAALRWGFDRYIEYGLRHPAHYQLMFQRRDLRPTPAGLASYDRLRRTVAAVDAAGRLRVGVEDAAAACWAGVHGVTSLVVTGGLRPDAPAIRLVREALIDFVTVPKAARERRRKGERTARWKPANRT